MPNRDESIAAVLEQARAQYVFSGFQFHGEGPRGPLSLSGGVTSYWDPKPVTDCTPFDIGSVTKAVATTSLFALAVEQGRLGLEDTLGAHVPELGRSPIGGLTLGQVLSHSAGLAAWLPVGKETSQASLAQWFVAQQKRVLTGAAGERAVYSDLGFLLLGLVAEKKFGNLEAAFRQNVAEPLGLKETRFARAPGAVATEYNLETGTLLQGVVFDDNCRELGGACAHAGLFSTARDLALWAAEWLKAWNGKSKWLGAKTAKLFTARSNRAPASSWAYGWDTRSDVGSSAGSRFSLSSFGHLGYPGCSVWIDPVGGHFACLLTNRVHPSRFDERIRQVRPVVHDAWAKYCGG